MTVCRGIVAAHGGRIWVQARPGGGASFRFTLPLSEAVGQDARTAPRPETSS
ncbi:MAG: ATP-binding protein [Polyangiaceae bacterium]